MIASIKVHLFRNIHTMSYIIQFLLSALAVLAASYIVPWVQVDWFMWALLVALVLWLVNATLWALLKLITLPLNWLTLGIVWLIINVLMVLFVDNLMTSFNTNWFWSAAVFALILAIIQSALGVSKK